MYLLAFAEHAEHRVKYYRAAHRVCYICATQTGETNIWGLQRRGSIDAVIPRAMCRLACARNGSALRMCARRVLCVCYSSSNGFLVNYDRGLCIVRSHGGKVAIVGARTCRLHFVFGSTALVVYRKMSTGSLC